MTYHRVRLLIKYASVRQLLQPGQAVGLMEAGGIPALCGLHSKQASKESDLHQCSKQLGKKPINKRSDLRLKQPPLRQDHDDVRQHFPNSRHKHIANAVQMVC